MIKNVLAVGLLAGLPLLGQISPPKAESRLHHITGPHRDDANELESRYAELRCALVVIRAEDRLGTGFYISADGQVITASHVLGNRDFEPAPNRQTRIFLHRPLAIQVTNAREEFTVSGENVEDNADQWGVDLAHLETARQAPCWLRIGDDRLSKVGEHVIALGFPGLAFGSLALYSGIISARVTSNLIIGYTRAGEPLTGSNELIRVQMPISPGVSGAPVIDDQNRVVAVVTSAGAWNPELDVLIQLQRTGAIPRSAPNTANLASSLADLAQLFHDFWSPGYGGAVPPMNYLGLPGAQQPQRLALPAH